MWDLLSPKIGVPIPPVDFLLGEDKITPTEYYHISLGLSQCHYLNVNHHTIRGNSSENTREMIQWRGYRTSQGSLEYNIGYFHRLGKNFYPYQKSI